MGPPLYHGPKTQSSFYRWSTRTGSSQTSKSSPHGPSQPGDIITRRTGATLHRKLVGTVLQHAMEVTRRTIMTSTPAHIHVWPSPGLAARTTTARARRRQWHAAALWTKPHDTTKVQTGGTNRRLMHWRHQRTLPRPRKMTGDPSTTKYVAAERRSSLNLTKTHSFSHIRACTSIAAHGDASLTTGRARASS